MKFVEKIRMVSHIVGFLLVVLITPVDAFGATVFYLDPDVSGGAHNGTQANPFNTLSGSAWTAINNALATGDVTIFCSARNASADTNQVWSQTIDLVNKTSNPAGTLTIDGKSFWNSNDTTPNWAAYTGTSRCNLRGQIANQNGVKRSKVTIDGIVFVQLGGNQGITICGDNWIIQNSDISAAATVSGGPLVLIGPTADAAHEGADPTCPASSNITIQDNVIHDSFNELIYVGGAGCLSSAVDADRFALRTNNGACHGVPSHSNITIQRNTLFNCGSRAAQGDCIDMKAGLTNVTISQNDISGNRNDNNSRCIVTQGMTMDGTNQNYLIERNKIHDCLGVDDAAIAIVQDWGTPNGIVIRNNIIANVTGGECIRIYDTQAAGVQIYNNTISGCQSVAIVAFSGTVTVRNNALLNNNGSGAQTTMSGTITSDHNAFSATWGGTCSACISGLTSAAFTNVGTLNFSLPASSVLIDRGATIASFSEDLQNTRRPQGVAWDVGAFEFTTGAQIPSPPQSPRLQ